MDTCIAIIMYCLRLFLLFTSKQLFFSFFSGDLPATNICLHANFKFGGVMVLAVQLFNKIKRKEKKRTKNLKKHVSLNSQMLCRNTFIFGECILYCIF